MGKLAKFYTKERFRITKTGIIAETLENDCLYSRGKYATKKTAADLPDDYLEGMYLRRSGYLSTKGVKHLLYVPNKVFNHMFKDDILYVSWDKEITDIKSVEFLKALDSGTAMQVNGFMIIPYLKAVEINSDMNIEGIKAQIEDKRMWFKNKYPEFYVLEVPEDKAFF